MKKIFNCFAIALLLCAFGSTTSFATCRSNCMGDMRGGGGMGIASNISTLPDDMPDENETEGLVKMREEEKLARDVYTTLYNTWNNPVFSRIATSEQRHMDSIKFIIDKYGISDPVVDDTAGVFQNPEVQDLYNKLVAEGSTSIEQAMLTGAAIEDLNFFTSQLPGLL